MRFAFAPHMQQINLPLAGGATVEASLSESTDSERLAEDLFGSLGLNEFDLEPKLAWYAKVLFGGPPFRGMVSVLVFVLLLCGAAGSAGAVAGAATAGALLSGAAPNCLPMGKAPQGGGVNCVFS